MSVRDKGWQRVYKNEKSVRDEKCQRAYKCQDECKRGRISKSV